jgi:hypothetical protein
MGLDARESLGCKEQVMNKRVASTCSFVLISFWSLM